MLRWPLHVLLLWVLVPLTPLILFKSFDEIGPHDEDVCFSWHETLDRSALGYTSLPAYDPKYGFDSWTGGDGVGWFGSRWWADYPFWPGGDPGLGANNPLPSKVRRWHIDGVHKGLFLLMAPALWTLWGLVYARHRLCGPARGKGFEVAARAPNVSVVR